MIAINEVFKTLPQEKQEEILKAAFQEFSTQGYIRASTNTIVKNVKISKGLLFYYFNNKQELFNDLGNISLNECEEILNEVFKLDTHDYIEWLYARSQLKLQLQQKHPEVLRFLGQLFLTDDLQYFNPETRERFQAVFAEAQRIQEDSIDTSLFRKDLPTELSKSMVTWIMDGYQKELMTKLEAQGEIWDEEYLDSLWNEYYQFLETLKDLFYKEDNNNGSH